MGTDSRPAGPVAGRPAAMVARRRAARRRGGIGRPRAGGAHRCPRARRCLRRRRAAVYPRSPASSCAPIGPTTTSPPNTGARAFLMPAPAWLQATGYSDVELAEAFNVPLDQVAERRLAPRPRRVVADRPRSGPLTRRADDLALPLTPSVAWCSTPWGRVADAARVLTDEDPATVTRDLDPEGVVAKRLDAPRVCGRGAPPPVERRRPATRRPQAA